MVVFMGIDTENLDFIDEVKRLYEYGFYASKLPGPYTLSTFSENHVFDEDKSVKWNFQKVIEENNQIAKLKNDFYEDERKLLGLLDGHFKVALMKEYDFNKEQADIIYGYLYSTYRRNYIDMFTQFYEVGEVISKVVKAASK